MGAAMLTQVLADVTTVLTEGPGTEPCPIRCPNGTLITVMWHELPTHVAAVLVVVSGGIWLLVSPTAPTAVGHAAELVCEACAMSESGEVVMPRSGEPETKLPQPRPPTDPAVNRRP